MSVSSSALSTTSSLSSAMGLEATSSTCSSSILTQSCSHSNTTMSSTAHLTHDLGKMQFQTNSKESKDAAKSTVESVDTPVKTTTTTKSVEEIKIPKGAFLAPKRCLQIAYEVRHLYNHFEFHNHIHTLNKYWQFYNYNYLLNHIGQPRGKFLCGAIEVMLLQKPLTFKALYAPFKKSITNYEIERDKKRLFFDLEQHMSKTKTSPQTAISTNKSCSEDYTTTLVQSVVKPIYTGQWRMSISPKEIDGINLSEFQELILDSWQKGKSGVTGLIQVIDPKDQLELFCAEIHACPESSEQRVAEAMRVGEGLKGAILKGEGTQIREKAEQLYTMKFGKHGHTIAQF